MRKVLFFGLILLFLLSSCSNSGGGDTKLGGFFGGSGSGGKELEEDNSGDGLKINFKVDSKWISIRRVDYELTLENTGKESIELSRNNFRLTTLQKNVQEGSDDVELSVFDSKTIDAFYNKIFQDGSLTLFQNQEVSVKGSLLIDQDFFEDLNMESFDYVLSAIYDYRTDFDNDVEIDLQEIDMKVNDLSQAAPVKITKMELQPSFVDFQEGGESYVVNYYVQDSGSGASAEKIVEIRDYDFTFSNSGTDCTIYSSENGKLRELENSRILLNKDRKEIIFSCRVDVSRLDSDFVTTTSTSGFLEYDYLTQITGKVSLPKEKKQIPIG